MLDSTSLQAFLNIFNFTTGKCGLKRRFVDPCPEKKRLVLQSGQLCTGLLWPWNEVELKRGSLTEVLLQSSKNEL